MTRDEIEELVDILTDKVLDKIEERERNKRIEASLRNMELMSQQIELNKSRICVKMISEEGKLNLRKERNGNRNQ